MLSAWKHWSTESAFYKLIWTSKQYKWIFYVYSFQNRFIFVRLYVCLYLFHDKINVILQIHINDCSGTYLIFMWTHLLYSNPCLFKVHIFLNFWTLYGSHNIYNQSFYFFYKIIYIYWKADNGYTKKKAKSHHYNNKRAKYDIEILRNCVLEITTTKIENLQNNDHREMKNE